MGKDIDSLLFLSVRELQLCSHMYSSFYVTHVRKDTMYTRLSPSCFIREGLRYMQETEKRLTLHNYMYLYNVSSWIFFYCTKSQL